MQTTIDKAGRVVIPRSLRDEVGITEGEVAIIRDGAGIRIEPIPGKGLDKKGGRLIIPPSGIELNDDLVRDLREADQR